MVTSEPEWVQVQWDLCWVFKYGCRATGRHRPQLTCYREDVQLWSWRDTRLVTWQDDSKSDASDDDLRRLHELPAGEAAW